MPSSQVTKFQKTIQAYYRVHGRNLPWRETRDPYKILVSEIMLQQTQVRRVLPKYELFIKTFPDFYSLKNAPVREIIKVWQGLGYNRRALALKKIALEVTEKWGGVLRSDPTLLETLPSIGPETGASIVTFAFNKPLVFIETNIRSVFLHFFFKNRDAVDDNEIRPLVRRTLDQKNPRAWYWALMDYGTMLKKIYGNPNKSSAHYAKQSLFRGSNREIRGAIIRFLTQNPSMKKRSLQKKVGCTLDVLNQNLFNLKEEGFLKKKRDCILLL